MSTRKQAYKLLFFLSPDAIIDHIYPHLSLQGYELHKADTFQETISMASQHSPDLIIIDRINEVDEENKLIDQLKQHTYTHTVPLLIATDFSDSKVIFKQQYGSHIDLIRRPYSPRELFVRIERQIFLHQTEDRLQKENRQLKTALSYQDKRYAIIAHDLRAPISTIKMLNATIAPQIQSIENRYILTLFNMVQTTTEEAFNLLENLLNWIQTQHGKTKIYASRFDINQAIHQTVSLFQAHLSQKRIALLEHTKQTTEVYADAEMIKTVLRNLISNAIKFTYPGGKIDVTTSKLSEYVLVCIRDSGKGISATEVKKINKSTTHLTTYGTYNERGNGLGLNISREFIRLNKGKFWFSSQEGIGSTFFFTLPHPTADQ